MVKPPSDVAKRARELLEQKDAAALPDAAKLRAAATERASSADAFFSGLVEGAFLLGAADGDLSPDEASTLGETVSYLTGEVVDPAEFMAMIDDFADALSNEGLDTRIMALASAVPDAPARKEILSFAVLVALCDRDLAKAERDTLDRLATAFKIPRHEVDELIKTVEASLG
jgi:hypothetical protein